MQGGRTPNFLEKQTEKAALLPAAGSLEPDRTPAGMYGGKEMLSRLYNEMGEAVKEEWSGPGVLCPKKGHPITGPGKWLRPIAR